MKVLIGCEFSGIVRQEFTKLGHDAWSCDLLETEIPGNHIQGSVLDVLNAGWDLAIFHPPCTYLTNAGVRHLHANVVSSKGNRAKVSGEDRWKAMVESAEFFKALKDAPIDKIAIENPIPHKYAREIIGTYSQIIQPWMFGHQESKATCLWLKNLPLLEPTDVVGPPPKNMPQEEKRKWHKVHYASPGPNRWKVRSRTYEGFARAFAQQWGGAV